MVLWLLDTNILIRAFYPTEPQHQQAVEAVRILRERGDLLCITLQGLAEFWSVCTRPAAARGGLGLTLEETEQRLQFLEQHTVFLVDGVAVRDHWRRLVREQQVLGVQVYDARLVACMLAHGVSHLLTFNTVDFQRYPGIIAVAPQAVLDGTA